jgi:phosphoglycolate phosphatase
MTLSTLIFDFDGTLVNSLDPTLRLANALAPEYGYRAAEPHEIEMLRSSSYRSIAAQLGIKWHKIPLIAARIRRELSSTVAEMGTFDGLPEVLKELRSRGLRFGILTSNARQNVERFLAAQGLTDFDFVTTSASVWGKQHRLKALLRRRGLSTAEVAYVGDEVRDIEATKALGICMIAVGWGYAAEGLLAAHAPDHLVRTPAELLTLPGLPGGGVPVQVPC